MTENKITSIISEINKKENEDLVNLIKKLQETNIENNDNEFTVDLKEQIENIPFVEKVLTRYFNRTIQIKDKKIFISPFIDNNTLEKIKAATMKALEEKFTNDELTQVVRNLIKHAESLNINIRTDQVDIKYNIPWKLQELVENILKNYFKKNVKIVQCCDGDCYVTCGCPANIRFYAL